MKRILVVDDDPDMRALYRHMLGGRGRRFAVSAAAHPAAAVGMLRRERFDLVISDIIMERTSGESFVARLRRDRPHGGIPILIVTVLGRETLPRMGDIRGIHYLQKPVTREALRRKISAILRAGGRGGEARTRRR
ncbi:MAG: response regulator [bacterium]|nr:response regulator [bacterium]